MPIPLNEVVLKNQRRRSGGCHCGGANALPGDDDIAGCPGAVLPRDCRSDRGTDRHRDVATPPRPRPSIKNRKEQLAVTRLVNHEDPTLPIHAYLDGELDSTNALAVERRMATDPALAAECERVEAL